MSLFDKKPSLMPVVIAPDVWQSVARRTTNPAHRRGIPQESHLYDLLPATAGRYESPCRITAITQLSRPLCAGLDG